MISLHSSQTGRDVRRPAGCDKPSDECVLVRGLPATPTLPDRPRFFYEPTPPPSRRIIIRPPAKTRAL
jgi:hypothetical protein